MSTDTASADVDVGADVVVPVGDDVDVDVEAVDVVVVDVVETVAAFDVLGDFDATANNTSFDDDETDVVVVVGIANDVVAVAVDVGAATVDDVGDVVDDADVVDDTVVFTVVFVVAKYTAHCGRYETIDRQIRG